MAEKGMLSLEDLTNKVKNEDIETVVVAFTDHYGRLIGKRFDAEFFLESCVENGTHGCDYLLTTDMEMEPVQGYKLSNWELGYGDFHMIPDLGTLREASWLDKSAMVLCDLVNEKNHSLIAEGPRSILKTQIERAEKLGFSCKAASELEYYLFEDSYKSAHQKNFHELDPAGWYLEDYHILQGSRTEHYTKEVRRHLKNSGIPVENSKGEWGLGQHELNIRYADILDMADRHVIYKQCMKEIADSKDMSVSFMAKFDESRAGSSCHIHMSLWDNDTNAFSGNDTIGPVNGSQIFKWFLGGWMSHADEVMPFYAPTVNSYKRYVDASWAPTRIAWSYDNRTAGFRVVGSGNSLRIECRIPGADVNPYLAFAAALASGLDGIENKIEPPACFEGDIYEAKHLPQVSQTLEESTKKFAESQFCNKVFGESVVSHYAHFFQEETRAFRKAVTDWERKRYFERI